MIGTNKAWRRSAIGAAAAAVVFAVAISGASAQQSPAKPAPAENDAQSSAWIKLCNIDETTKKQLCVVSQELRDAKNGQLLASAAIRLMEGDKKLMIFAVPTGMLLPPGLRIQIDKDKPAEAKFTICFPNACVARMEVDDNFIAGMKKGSELAVIALSAQQKQIGFPMTLAGFTKAYDGAPVDPKLYEQAQKNLAAEIERRAEEERKKQEAEQGKAPAKAQ